VAPVAESLLLDPPTGPIDHPSPDPDDMERVRDCGGIGQMRGECRPEGFVEIGDGDDHTLAPALGLVREPGGQLRAAASLDHIDHAAPSDVADRTGPPGRLSPASGQELGLIHPHRSGLADPAGILDERPAQYAVVSMMVCQVTPSWRAT